MDEFSQAHAEYETAIQKQPKKGPAYNNLAWQLATCPDKALWDADRAVELAKEALRLTPEESTCLNTLGVAYYRAGDWHKARETLNRSKDLRSGGDSFDWFFLAMAHWQLGEKDEARTWYDKAVEWMDENKPDDEELIRFRAEAAELLGITDTPL
jgi:tetratricopeptide (TPR) repeat protein